MAGDNTLALRAFKQLGLAEGFDPPTAIDAILQEAQLGPEIFTYLKNSQSDEAKKVSKLYWALPQPQRKEVTIDHLIAAAGVDHIKVLGSLTEELYRIKSEVATLIAAVESPDTMRATAAYAQQPKGHQDRKMLLQTARVAPVPTNQITRVNMGNVSIDNRKITQNNIVPSLEDVVRDMDVVQKAIPDVSSPTS
jgi:hypothetical protein